MEPSSWLGCLWKACLNYLFSNHEGTRIAISSFLHPKTVLSWQSSWERALGMCRWVLNRTATGDRRRPCFINKGAKKEIQLPQQGQWMPSVVPQDITSDLPPLLQKCVHAPWIPWYTCQPLWVAEIPGISNGTGYQCICSAVLHFMQQIRGTGSDPLVFSRQCFRAEFWKLIPIKQRTKRPSCGKSFQAVLDEVQSVQLPHSREFASHSPELSHSAFYLEFS